MITFGSAAAMLLTTTLSAAVLTSCGSGTSDSRTVADDAPAYVGQWQLTALTRHGSAVDLSGVEQRTMTLTRRSGLLFDGCNTHNLRFSVAARRITVTDDAQTAGVCAPGPWTRLMDAVSAVTTTSSTRPGEPAVPVTYTVDDTGLTLSAAPYTLHFTRTATRVPPAVSEAPASPGS